jgi:hypothetical protein
VGAQDGRVQGNLIGVAANGSAPLPNGGSGIEINDSNNLIGEPTAGAGNIIAFNVGDGVDVLGSSTGGAILSNSIYSNRGFGILLGPGAPANDPGDVDTGANGYQNYPVITAATSSKGDTIIEGSLNSAPNAAFHLEFFASSVLDAPARTQGENLIGTTEVTTDGSGKATFNLTFPQANDGRWVTATATDASGNTSQLAAAVGITGPALVNATAITARNGSRFRLQIVSSGGSASQRITATGLPPGLVLDSVSGIISGRPTMDGNYDVNLELSDGLVTATGTLHIEVVSDPNRAVIVSPSEATVTGGQSFTYKIDAPTANSATDPVIYSLQGVLPVGLSFDAKTGTISGNFSAIKIPGPPDVDALSGGVITNVQLFAKNSGGTGTRPLVFFLAPVGTVNISTRMAVGTGENVMIGGFIITGNAPKRVIIRALGPSLNASGLTGTLQDPTLELFDGAGAPLGSNDDWRSDQEDEIIATSIAPTDERESAALATLAPGNYTAIVSGKNATSGVGLVEVYDLGTASLDSSSAARLAQISTRGRVLTNENVMIGGFIVSGASVNVLVRGIGPSLSNAGVTDALADPTLSLVDSNGQELASNDNWKDTQRSAIEATTVPPANDAEAAILHTLAPGQYTAILRGKSDSTGVGLVEVYSLQ